VKSLLNFLGAALLPGIGIVSIDSAMVGWVDGAIVAWGTMIDGGLIVVDNLDTWRGRN
jgi:hypothetical protein